jgi:hypothetical protein
MFVRTLSSLSALVVVGLALFQAAPAQAATRFAMVSIANETSYNITFSYRWGDGAWQSTTMAPGARRWFSWKYPQPNENRSPAFQVRFDADGTGSKYIEKYDLKRRAAVEQNYDLGHKYAFRFDGPSKRYIELYNLE